VNRLPRLASIQEKGALMKSWRFARRRSIRLFKLDHHIVALVVGTKPRTCEVPKLKVLGAGRVVLHCECAKECTQHSGKEDDYFIVAPLTGLESPSPVELLHKEGTDLLTVEALSECHTVQGSGKPTILGVSQDFSLEAALKDALCKLSLVPDPAPGLVEVVSMGVLYGGFSGCSRGSSYG
jgi:hypothetical protein